MTKYTPNMNIPYPEDSDAPRGWEQMKNIADTVDPMGRWAACYGSDLTAGGGPGFQPLKVVRRDGSPDMPAANIGYGITIQQPGYYTLGLFIRFVGKVGQFGGILYPSAPTYGAQPMANTYTNAWNGTDVAFFKAGTTVHPFAESYQVPIEIRQVAYWVRWLGPASNQQLAADEADADAARAQPYEG